MNEELLNKSYYAIIPATVRYNKKLKDKAKLLYGEITALCNENGFCWATNSYFAGLFSVSKETVSRLLSDLKKQGYIKIEFEYDEKTKEIKKRLIYLLTKSSIGIDEKIIYPIDEKIKENNINIYNNILGHFSEKKCFSKVTKLTDSRKLKLSKRLKEHGEENIIKAIDIAANSDFLKGKNDRNWKMDFDWLIANDTNIVKILEGKYSSYKEPKEEKGRMYGPILN